MFLVPKLRGLCILAILLMAMSHGTEEHATDEESDEAFGLIICKGEVLLERMEHLGEDVFVQIFQYCSRITTILSNLNQVDLLQNATLARFNERMKTLELIQSSTLAQLNERMKTLDLQQNSTLALLNERMKTSELPESSALAQLNERMKTLELQQNSPLTQLNERMKTLELQQNSPLTQLNERMQTFELQQNSALAQLNERMKTSELLQSSTLDQLNERMKTLELQPSKFQDLVSQMINFPHADVYSGDNFMGDSENYRFDASSYLGGCHDLKNLQERVRSVNTFGKCVRLFYGTRCSGWSLAVYPGSGNSGNVLNSKLIEVDSIGPCLPEEFQKAYLAGTGGLDMVKDARDVQKYFPDLIEFISYDKSHIATNSSAPEFSVSSYTQGHKGRLEFIFATVEEIHMGISQPDFDAENSEFYRSLDKRPGDVAGYAVPTFIGGPANQNYNIFPQAPAAREELTKLGRKIEIHVGTDAPTAPLFSLNLIYEDSLASRPYAIYYWINYSDKEIGYGRILN